MGFVPVAEYGVPCVPRRQIRSWYGASRWDNRRRHWACMRSISPSGSAKRLTPAGFKRFRCYRLRGCAADGKSVFVSVNSGTLTRIVSFPANGAGTERPLFTVTSTVWFLDAGPDGSVYVSMLDRPSDLAQFSIDGTRFERLASFPLVPEDADIMTILPDGRVVIAIRASGQNRLMVVQKGKDPAPLVNTTEETMAPVAACGSGEVAFMIGPAPYETIAFTEPAIRPPRTQDLARQRVRLTRSPVRRMAGRFIFRRAA